MFDRKEKIKYFENFVSSNITYPLNKEEQEQFLRQFKKDTDKSNTDAIFFGLILPIIVFYLIFKFYKMIFSAIASTNLSRFQKLLLFLQFFTKGK